MIALCLDGFQPCDLRGRYGETPDFPISPWLAFLLARAVARRLPAGERVLLAGDGRFSTPRLLRALEGGFGKHAAVLLGSGIPTPLAYFAKHAWGLHSVLIVTASHNPSEFNGIKLQLGKCPVTPELLAELRDEVAEDDRRGRGIAPPAGAQRGPTAAGRRAWREYADALVAHFGRADGAQRIAVDAMHGCYARRAGEVLTMTGYSPVCLRNRRRPDFGGTVPDCADDRNLARLCRTVRTTAACFGAAFDGDGDRVRLVAETGQPVDNGTVLYLLARYAVDTRGKTVVYDQKLRLAVLAALRRAGCVAVREKSGHAFIRARMLAEHAVLGGESSGHFFWGVEHPAPAGDCGLFTTLAVARVLRQTGQPLSRLAADVASSPFYTGDIRNLRLGADRAILLAAVAARLRQSEYAVDTTDGVRVEARDGTAITAFAHLRASVTEADMLTACFDAATDKALREIGVAVCTALPATAAAVAEVLRERLGEVL